VPLFVPSQRHREAGKSEQRHKVHPAVEGIVRQVHLCTRVHMRRTDVWQDWPEALGIAGGPFKLGLDLEETRRSGGADTRLRPQGM
jgi:hypothetical protein